MKILVTGAAGFIGSHLCERLLARGESVVGVDNFDAFYDRALKEQNLSGFLRHERFSFYPRDIRDAAEMDDLWSREGGGLDAVVHLAARAGVRPSIADPVGYEQTNQIGTLNLLQRAAAEGGACRFVFASSSSVYGNAPKVPFAETDNVDLPISPYAATKKAGELTCHVYHHLFALPVTCLRFFTVYGPRQRPDLAIRKFATAILAGKEIEVFGDGSSSRDYTYIDDIVDGVTAAVDRCAGYEIVNLGGSCPISLSEMIETIERACGKKAKIVRKPTQPGDVERTFADVSKAGELLGYAPKVAFSEGIRRTVEWLRQQG